MLDIVEKVIWGLAGVAVLLVGATFWLLGAPSTRPYIGTRSEVVSTGILGKNLSDEQRERLKQVSTETVETERNGRKRKSRIKFEARQIDQSMFERVSNLTDAAREAHRASSTVTPEGYLEIDDFGENNLFERLGFQEKDQITGIDGEEVDFSNRMQARDYFKHFKEKLETNGFIYVDLIRNGKNTRIGFALE